MWRRAVRLVVCVASFAASTVLVGIADGPVVAQDAPVDDVAVDADAGPVEVESLRSERSSTVLAGNGSMVTTVSPVPVYFLRDDQWVPIDTTLRRDGDGWRPTSSGVDVRLPAALGGAVEVAGTGGSVSLTLRAEAAGRGLPEAAAEVAGSRASYRAGGLEARYTALPTGVKEEFVVADASSVPSVLTYDVALSDGLRLEAALDGGAVVVDAAGVAVFSLPAPYAYDSAGSFSAVALAIVDGALVLTPDAEWLASAERVWPVVLDPTVTYGATTTCPIASNSSANWWCTRWDLPVGSTSGVSSRSLLSFGDLSNVLPLNTTILAAQLSLEVADRGNGATMSIGAYPLTASFASGATWTSRNGTNNWTTAGSDFTASTGVVNANANQWGRTVWPVTHQVQDQVRRETPSVGFVLKQVSENGSNTMKFLSPYSADSTKFPKLVIEHTWDVADSASDGLWRQQLTDRSSIAVDVSTGNLTIDVTDFAMAGTGLSATVRRSFDSLRSYEHGQYGKGWVQVEGNGTYLRVPTVGFPVLRSRELGAPAVFKPNGSGGWIAPPGLNADLTSSGSTWTLTFRGNGEKWRFTAGSATIDNAPVAMLTSRVDRNSNTITYNYDYASTAPDGTPRQTNTIDTQGRELDFDFGFYVSNADDVAGGRTVTYGYVNDQLRTVTDAAGKTTSYTYGTGDRITQIVDPTGHTTQITYETSYPYRVATVKRITNPSTGAGSTWTFTYASGWTQSGNQWLTTTTLTDPNNHATVYQYDTRNRVVKVTDALNRARETSWTPNNAVATLTDSLSAVTNATYDATTNNLLSVQAAQDGTVTGRTTSFAYNNTSHPYYPSTATDTQGNQLAYAYDTAGNVTSVTNGLSSANQIVATYNADGTIASRTDAGGSCTGTTSRCTTYTYTWNYSGSTRTTLASVFVDNPSPLGDETTTFDVLGRTATMTDGKGQVTHYTWNSMDRLTRITFNNTPTCNVAATCATYGYDDDGNLTSRVDASGTTTYTYDRLDRVTQEARPGSTASMTYDGVGNVLTFTDVNGTIAYGYNAANDVTSLAEPGGTCTAPTVRCTTFGYDGNGRRTTITSPNGVVTTIGYDASGRETSIDAIKSGTAIVAYDYTYRTATGTDTGLVSSAVDVRLNQTTSYGYDVLNRLTAATTRNSSNTIIDQHAYVYDAASNRTSTTSNGVTTLSAFNQANQLCWTAATTGTCASTPSGGTGYSYDANGNQTATSAGYSASFNSLDQTTSVTPAGGTATAMTYADIDQTQRLTAGSTSFVHTPLGVTRQTIGGVSQHYIRDPYGNLIAVRTGSSSYYYVLDRLGSIVAVTDNTGAVAARYTYDPYGQATATGTFTQPWQYASGHRDANTGQIKFGTRYYQPNLGRWTQPDPAGYPDGPNNYLYVNANPGNLIDPTGRWGLSLSGLACSVICIGGTLSFDFSSGEFDGKLNVGAGPSLGLSGTLGTSFGDTSGLTTTASCQYFGSVSITGGDTGLGFGVGGGPGWGCATTIDIPLF